VSKAKRAVLILGCLAVLVPIESVAERYVRGALFLARFSAPAGESAKGRQEPLEETEIEISGSPERIRARLYRIAGAGPRPGVVVAHGVHYQGIDEGRLVPFARALARSGFTVLTPQLQELTEYRVSVRDIAVIDSAVAYLSGRQDVASTARVGLIGFSFAGGLGLIAAGHPQTEQHLKYVASVGGHYDLMQVMQFLITGEVQTPEGKRLATPHEYGLVILAYQYLDHLAPKPDLQTLGAAFKAWLHEDRDSARRLAQQLQTQEGRHLFNLLENQHITELSGTLLAILAEHRTELAELSPRDRLKALHVPVYLLHGASDSVIPPSQTAWAARELDAAGVANMSLITPLIEHVEVEKNADLVGKLHLVRFMAQLF
jgi:dienelactone hydrolase